MISEKHLFLIKHCYIKLLLIALLLVIAHGCAPKQVRIYQTVDGIRNNVIQYAVELLGKPYRSGAKGPDSFDCSGLVYYIYKKANIILPVTTESLLKTGLNIPQDNILPGDLVFFKIKKNLHSGILINKTDFIHSSNSKGVTVDNINSKYWQKNLIGFRSVL